MDSTDEATQRYSQPSPRRRSCWPRHRRAPLAAAEPGQVFFGVSDTGVNSEFPEFSELVGKHPPVIETFRTWGSDLTGSIRRWQKAEARPILHISTADPNDGHELIDPRQIANGYGDSYLVALNYLFWSQGMRAYIRPLGEPNRCLNVYASYDCAGDLRAPSTGPTGTDRRSGESTSSSTAAASWPRSTPASSVAGLPPLREEGAPLPTGLPKAPVAVLWSPLPVGSPEVRSNRPERFYPGRAYTDWAGTDFYSDYPDWKSLTQMYDRYRGRPVRPHRVGSRPAATTRPSSSACSSGSGAILGPGCSSTTRTSATSTPSGSRTSRPAST